MKTYLILLSLLTLATFVVGACAPGNARRQYQASVEQYRACLQTTNDCERQRRLVALDERAYRNVEGRGYTITSED